MTLAEIAEVVGGSLVGSDALVTGAVEYDSRKVGPGGLFVAFAGEKVDGHDFAAKAVADGAAGLLGERAVDGVPSIVVADPRDAMTALAHHVVTRLPDTTVVGLTGSSGKTTTKDYIGQVLARVGATVAPTGSLNNELGHPYTVLKAGPDTRFLVLEIGARGIGHVAHLCRIAPPHIGVELNVGTSHIGEFGSVEAIARAKGELVEALPAAGAAVLNADDPRVRAMATRTAARVVLYGEAGDAEIRAADVEMDARGRPSYRLVTPGGTAAVKLQVTGRHQVANTLAAAAVATLAGLPVAEIAAALSELRLVSARRMDVFDRADGVTVIDDSYNANPASMTAALHAQAALAGGRRRIAVLGYMAELGEHERAGHEEVGALAARLGVEVLVVVGTTALPIHQGATATPEWGGASVVVEDQDAAVALLRDELRDGDVVLVKGSRYRTWQVADALRDDTGAGEPGGSA